MGTGSFGGGSGSFGAGGSGSTGSGSSRSRTKAAGGSKGSGGSVAQLVESLLRLTWNVNKDPTLSGARKVLSEMLQDRGRREFFLTVLRSPFVQGVLKDLIALSRQVRSQVKWSAIAAKYQLNVAEASLSALARALVREHQSRSIDERHLEIVRLVLSDIFLKAVGNDLAVFQRTTPDKLAARFDTKVLASISGYYLSGLMRRVVRKDIMEMSPELQISMETASREIADGWYERFEVNYIKRHGKKREDLLAVIADNYHEFAFAELPTKAPTKVAK
jgi:hypothetical protein